MCTAIFTARLFSVLLIASITLGRSTTQPPDIISDVLGQILGLVQGMKGQLDNLKVKVDDLDLEMKEVKSQTVSSTEIMKDQLKGVKARVSSAMEEYEEGFDDLLHQVSTTIENVTNGLRGDSASSKYQSMYNETDALNSAISSKLDVIQLTLEEYITNGSYLCNKDDVISSLDLDTLQTNITTQLSNVFQSVESIRSNDIAALGEKLEASDVTREVNLLSDKTDVLNSSFERFDSRLKELKSQMEAVDGRMSATQVNTDAKLDRLLLKAYILLLNFENPRFDPLGTSYVFKGKLYLLTKKAQKFDINDASRACQEFDGHLVDFDDDEEYEFVESIVQDSRHDRDAFLTGYSDIAQEGKFVHVTSGQQLKNDYWMPGEPNDANNNEDCVNIYNGYLGLNDLPCDYFDARYICEVPYPF